MIWNVDVEFVIEIDRCEMAFLYLNSERPQVSRTAEGMDEFDVYPVRHGSRFLDLGYGGGPNDPYNKEHISHRLSQGYLVSVGSVTARRYLRKDQKGLPYTFEIQSQIVQVDQDCLYLAVALKADCLVRFVNHLRDQQNPHSDSKLTVMAEKVGRSQFDSKA